MNPELVRNLRLECSPQRLVAMPVVLGLVLTVASLTGGFAVVGTTADLAIGALLILWGGRLAADSVLGEMADRTWDSQRMSAIGPWSMTWGKLFGSTVFVWYGALFCLIVTVIAGSWQSANGVPLVAHLIVAGLMCQALALFFSLLLSRGRPERWRFRVTLTQLFAIAVSLPFAIGAALLASDWVPQRTLSWYGFAIPADDFLLATNLSIVAWGIFGCYRLMRAELQCRTGFLGWLGFTVFLAVYWAGLDAASAPLDLRLPGERTLDGWLMAFGVTLVLTYAAAFAEPKGIVRLRRWLRDLRLQSWRRAATETPSWAVSGVVCVICALNAIDLLTPTDATDGVAWLILSILLFASRDIALIYVATLDNRRQRGHQAALVYLVVLYVLIPGLLAGVRAEELVPAFVPILGAGPLMGTLPVLLQLALVLGLLAHRWRGLAGQTTLSPPAPGTPGRPGD